MLFCFWKCSSFFCIEIDIDSIPYFCSINGNWFHFKIAMVFIDKKEKNWNEPQDHQKKLQSLPFVFFSVAWRMRNLFKVARLCLFHFCSLLSFWLYFFNLIFVRAKLDYQPTENFLICINCVTIRCRALRKLKVTWHKMISWHRFWSALDEGL